MTTTSVRTIKQRWTSAWRNIERRGVTTILNNKSCCRSCAMAEFQVDLGLTDETELGWTYAGQGSGTYFYKDGSPKQNTTWIYHSGPNAGTIIADEMRAEGFEVTWDGSAGKAVLVTLS